MSLRLEPNKGPSQQDEIVPSNVPDSHTGRALRIGGTGFATGVKIGGYNNYQMDAKRKAMLEAGKRYLTGTPLRRLTNFVSNKWDWEGMLNKFKKYPLIPMFGRFQNFDANALENYYNSMNDDRRMNLDDAFRDWFEYRYIQYQPQYGGWATYSYKFTPEFKNYLDIARVGFLNMSSTPRNIPPPPGVRKRNSDGNWEIGIEDENQSPSDDDDGGSGGNGNPTPGVRGGKGGGKGGSGVVTDEMKKKTIKTDIVNLFNKVFTSINNFKTALKLRVTGENVIYTDKTESAVSPIQVKNLHPELELALKIASIDDYGINPNTVTLGQFTTARARLEGYLQLIKNKGKIVSLPVLIQKVLKAIKILNKIEKSTFMGKEYLIKIPDGKAGGKMKDFDITKLYDTNSKLFTEVVKDYLLKREFIEIQDILNIADTIINDEKKLQLLADMPDPDKPSLFTDYINPNNLLMKQLIEKAGFFHHKNLKYDLNKLGDGDYFKHVAKIHKLNEKELREDFYNSEHSLVMKLIIDYFITIFNAKKVMVRAKKYLDDSKLKPKMRTLVNKALSWFDSNRSYQVLYFLPSKILINLPAKDRKTNQVRIDKLNFYNKVIFPKSTTETTPGIKTQNQLQQKTPKQDPNKLRQLKSDLQALGIKLEHPISNYTVKQLEVLKAVGFTNQQAVKSTLVKTKAGAKVAFDFFANEDRNWVEEALSLKQIYGLQVTGATPDPNNRTLLLDKLNAYYSYVNKRQRPKVFLGRFRYDISVSTDHLSVYKNENSKEVMVGFKGTEASNVSELLADVVTIFGDNITARSYSDWVIKIENLLSGSKRKSWLYFKKRYEELLRVFQKYPSKNLGDGTYKYTFQGHSLGSVTALIMNAWLANRRRIEKNKFPPIRSTLFNMFAFKDTKLRNALVYVVGKTPNLPKTQKWIYQYHIKDDPLSIGSVNFLPSNVASFKEYDFTRWCAMSLTDAILEHFTAMPGPNLSGKPLKGAGQGKARHSMANFLHEVFLLPADRCNFKSAVKKVAPKLGLSDILTTFGVAVAFSLIAGKLSKRTIERYNLQQRVADAGGFPGRAGSAYSGTTNVDPRTDNYMPVPSFGGNRPEYDTIRPPPIIPAGIGAGSYGPSRFDNPV